MSKKKILAVDDEIEVLGLLERRLKASGYEVFTATNGRDALLIARREMPDLVVMDILMPEMDGSETAATLHEDPKTKDIPVLFLTCLFTKREEYLEGHEIGQSFFVAKPYEPKDLWEEISKIIGKSSA